MIRSLLQDKQIRPLLIGLPLALVLIVVLGVLSIEKPPLVAPPYGTLFLEEKSGSYGLMNRTWMAAQLVGTENDLRGVLNVCLNGPCQNPVPIDLFPKGYVLNNGYTFTVPQMEGCQGVKYILFVISNALPSQLQMMQVDIPDVDYVSGYSTLQGQTSSYSAFSYGWFLVTIAPEDRLVVKNVMVQGYIPDTSLWAVTLQYDCPPPPEYGYSTLSLGAYTPSGYDFGPLFNAVPVERAVAGQWRIFPTPLGNVPFQYTELPLGAGSTLNLPNYNDIYLLVAWQGQQPAILDSAGVALGEWTNVSSTPDGMTLSIWHLALAVPDAGFDPIAVTFSSQGTVLGATYRMIPLVTQEP